MKAYCVETAAIRYNLEKLTRLAGKTPIWAVLKGNGYGLGTGKWPSSAMRRASAAFA